MNPFPPAAPAAHPAEGQLRTLVRELKKQESALTPNVQKILEEATLQHQQADTKWLHSAVARMGHAKKSLQEAHSARNGFHHKWTTFLSTSVERWQGYVKEFAAQDQALDAQILKAQEALSNAKADLEETKSKVTANDVKMEEEDEEEERPHAGHALLHNLEGMLQSLESLKTKADEALAEQAKKKQRLTREAAKEVIDLEGGEAASQNAPPHFT